MANSTNSGIIEELDRIKSKLKPPSIAVIGRTGSGKSSLIKAIFKLDDDQIKAGAGFPQTEFYKRYPNPYDKTIPILLYDSPGYEAHKTDNFLKDTISFLKEKATVESNSIDDKIHLVWHVIHAGLARFEYFDRTVIETVSSLGIPVVIVLNQCDTAKVQELAALKKTISELKLPKKAVYDTIEVAADPLPMCGKPFGLDNLVKTSIEMIPEIYTDAFVVAQQVNIKDKKKVAWTYVVAAVGVCFASAYIPVPGSVPGSVLAVQTGLLTSISEVYNVRNYISTKINVTTFTLTTALSIVATGIVDVISTALFWITPLWVTSETINGAVAATYITVVGLAMIATLEALSLKFLQSEMNQEQINEFFKERFREELKRFSKINISSPSDLALIQKQYID